MNVSTKNSITIQKILAICSLKTDIIFLSDLRLNSTKQISAVHDLEKHFFFNGYKLYHNSNLPSRGVGILFKKSISEKLVVNRIIKERDCNSLIINATVNGNNFVFASVYGPNHDTEIEFYDTLMANLSIFPCPIIAGGDWNATLDTAEVGVNVDVVNMRNIPSLRRSLRIHELCTQLSLSDPFRVSNPVRKEYTYIPTSLLEHNRSRIDYLLFNKPPTV